MSSEALATCMPPLEVEIASSPPADWKAATLGDIITLEYGKALPDKLRRAGDVAVYGSNGVVGVHDEALVSTGGIIVGRKGTAGSVTVSPSPFWPIDTTYFVKERQTVDWRWLAATLHHARLNELNEATGVPGLNRDKAYGQPVLLPPLDEQRRIAEVLRSMDEAIAANEIALQQRDRIRQGFSTLFQRGIGHSNFKPSAIGTIPASWQISTMNDVCHNVGVGIASSATHAYVDQGVPLLRNQNIKPGHLDLQDLLFVTEEYDRSYATKRVQTGDIITMRTGYPGRSAVIPPELDGCQTFTTLISRPKTSVVDPAFLCAWINSEPGMVEIRKRQAGGAQQNLNAGAIKQVPVPLPPLEEQRQIAGLLSNFPTEDDALISNLRNTRKLLQADLLSGRVRVPA